MKRINRLDEMQEQELLKIEHNGCWLAFWMLLASLVIQSVFFSGDMKVLAGEWIVFMVLCFYLAIACVRKGIWDRSLRMNTRTNLLCSAAAAAVLGVIWAIRLQREFSNPFVSAVTALITAAFTFAACFIALSIAMKVTAKRKAKMEEEPSDANEM